ncbi:RhoGAP-domain-containing protein [Yamadazyma tenuis ATCC 10573]|uniref:RhoGAP-domain-containing protein n=2 Tax=Candida tenuis TaxID=2315449 RepID=G3BCA2_CANTC|nr:RhoGAP-domain-containing protein [Yamadazyma tenuis ATCC 10573]EGV60151.1 RhoGAP-domain-containing protein [Yamadazyma tenuis ATCC 10573]
MSTIADTHDPFAEENIQNCKRCSNPIYEGHAYELGDDRWHINCFRCSKCDSSLGCNSNFLVLGNGNLICSNCSYNCKQCGKKIDDLAILTGDQAYCSSCFKCRACKQKIEDLRYARTSKGLFCMSCHEKLMAKKKKYDMKKKTLRKDKDKKLDHIEKDRDLKPTNSSSTVEVSTPLLDELEEKPLTQPQTVSTSVLQSESDLYDLYDRSRSPTPQLSSKTSSANELYKSITRSSSTMSKAKDLPSTPDLIQPFDSKKHKKSQAPISIPISAPVPPDIEQPEPKKASIDREFSIEEINDSDDELNQRDALKSPGKLQPAVEIQKHHNLKLPTSPASVSHTKFQGKNLLILSPGQNSEEALRSPKSPESIPFDKASLGVESDQARSRSSCPSPFAKNNRHARVFDAQDNDNDNNDNNDNNGKGYNDYNDNVEGLQEDTGDKTIEPNNSTPTVQSSGVDTSAELATPKRKHHRTPSNTNFSSPPPRMPLPSVPPLSSTPLQNRRNSIESDNYYLGKAINNDEFLSGLGLEGVEYSEQNGMQHKRTGSNSLLKNTKIVMNPTPTVTNLEESPNDSSLHRMQSIMKTPRLGLRHKRSISGGSNNGSSSISKLNFFKGRDDRGHSRHVSDGSISGAIHNGGSGTYMAPGFTVAVHSRSTSENNYINHRNFEFSDILSGTNDFDLKALRLEVSQLEAKKGILGNDVKKLEDEKQKLGEEIEVMRVRYNDEFRRLDTLSKEVTDLRVHKRDLESKSSSSEETAVHTAHQISHHPSNSSSSLVNHTTEIGNDEVVEAQKATKLKFWRRAKMGFNNGPNLVVPATGTFQVSPNRNEDEDGGKKGFGLMTKSRSTNILDSFLSSNTALSDSQSQDGEPSLFNSSIEKRARLENSAIPLIVTRCIQEVEERGLDLEGIYRISGGNSTIIAIEQAFTSINPRIKDDRNLAKLNEVLDCDINAITSALKRYLRKIPNPLIPFEVYNDFIKLNSVQSSTKKIAEFKSKIIDQLPDSNRQVLHLLCKHLQLVDSYSNVNRMNYKNLSVVFAPTIARDETGQREMMDMGSRNDMTEFLLTNYSSVFD